MKKDRKLTQAMQQNLPKGKNTSCRQLATQAASCQPGSQPAGCQGHLAELGGGGCLQKGQKSKKNNKSRYLQ